MIRRIRDRKEDRVLIWPIKVPWIGRGIPATILGHENVLITNESENGVCPGLKDLHHLRGRVITDSQAIRATGVAQARSMAVARDGSHERNPLSSSLPPSQRFYPDDSFSDADDRFKGRPVPGKGRPNNTDGPNYTYNNGLDDQTMETYGNSNGSGEGPGTLHENHPTRHPIRTKGLPAVLPDPGVQFQANNTNNMGMSNNANAANVAANTGTNAATSAFGFLTQSIGNPLAKSNSQPSVGGGFMQKIASIGAPSAATDGSAVEGIFSKGKDMIFKKFGL